MNAIDMYKIMMEERGAEFTTLNNKLMIKQKHSTSYQDVEASDRNFARIKNCIEQRNKNKSNFWTCSCGICTNYLLAQCSFKINNKSDNKTEASILDEAFNELFTIPSKLFGPSNPTPTELSSLNSTPNELPKANNSSSHPMDNMILTFGKYKDKSFKYVFDSDKEYCIWCIESTAIERNNNSRSITMMMTFVSYVKDKIKKL